MMHGWTIDGIPVKRQVGMIYWYSWGEHEFDIRILRRVLGLPPELTADKYFMAKRPDPRAAFINIMNQITLSLDGRKFMEVIAEHDRLLDEEEEADRLQRMAQLEKWKEIEPKLPRVFRIGDLSDLITQIKAGADFSKGQPKELILSNCDDECPF